MPMPSRPGTHITFPLQLRVGPVALPSYQDDSPSLASGPVVAAARTETGFTMENLLPSQPLIIATQGDRYWWSNMGVDYWHVRIWIRRIHMLIAHKVHPVLTDPGSLHSFHCNQKGARLGELGGMNVQGEPYSGTVAQRRVQMVASNETLGTG